MTESLNLTGRHLIDGEWIGGDEHFSSAPVTGAPQRFARGVDAEIDRAMRAAEASFPTYRDTSREDRAAFLETIADEIEARAEAITAIGTAETGLPEARLQGERGRTIGQLRLFADHIRKGVYLDRRVDPALPDRKPAPRPEIRMIERPMGPVGVFGASNFPLAFSTAGGDTASALAAGCPVVVKGHPAHPGTGEVVAQAIDAARQACDMPSGVFALVQSDTVEAGAALVQHALTRAVGFTGSLRGGRALYDLACGRDEPIPFYGELGSVNPVFVLPAALAARGSEIGKGWAGSLTMGVGQFCTNPGIVILQDGAGVEDFLTGAQEALAEVGAQIMLTDGIAEAYRGGVDRLLDMAVVRERLRTACDGRSGAPGLFEVDGEAFLANPELAHEVFGPAGLVVRAADAVKVGEIAAALEGQLTCTLQMDDADTDAARALVPVLERKAGRLLVNGFPTGVEVCDAMVHGGPYPASTNFGHTSVGTLAIRRWLRPVAYQNVPSALLPEDLRD